MARGERKPLSIKGFLLDEQITSAAVDSLLQLDWIHAEHFRRSSLPSIAGAGHVVGFDLSEAVGVAIDVTCSRNAASLSKTSSSA